MFIEFLHHLRKTLCINKKSFIQSFIFNFLFVSELDSITRIVNQCLRM